MRIGISLLNELLTYLRASPIHTMAYCNRGLVYEALGNYQQAMSDYDMAISLDSTIWISYSNRGNAYIRLGKFKEALKDFDRGVDLDPKNPKAYYDRAVAYDRLKNYPRSMYNLKTAAKLGHKGAQNILKSKGIDW